MFSTQRTTCLETIFFFSNEKAILALPIIVFWDMNIFQDIAETLLPLLMVTFANSIVSLDAMTLFDSLIGTPIAAITDRYFFATSSSKMSMSSPNNS
jgi:hypothetical protein